VAFASRLFDVWGGPIILQEQVQGIEYAITIVSNKESEIEGICAIRKFGISAQGKTWMAVTVDANPFIPMIDSIVKKLNWVGPLEIECICDENGDNPVVIEINPRFPAWLGVSRYAGLDLLELLIKIIRNTSSGSRQIAHSGACFARTYSTSSFPIENMAKLYSSNELVFNG